MTEHLLCLLLGIVLLVIGPFAGFVLGLTTRAMYSKGERDKEL